MQSKLFLATLCLCFLAISGLAQPTELVPYNPESAEVLGEVISLLSQNAVQTDEEKAKLHQLYKTLLKIIGRQSSDSTAVNVVILAAMQDPAVGAAWGVSDEQKQQITVSIGGLIQEEPVSESQESSEIAEQEEAVPDHPPVDSPKPEWAVELENALSDSPAIDISTVEGMAIFSAIVGMAIMDMATGVLNEVLTPEQWHIINESLLANIGEEHLISPNLFGILDLTDEQRDRMAHINKELESDLETMLENWVDGELTLMKIMSVESVEFESVQESGTEFPDNDAIRKRLMSENPDYKRIHEEMQSQSNTFFTKFKTQMFDVLTDEQWFRLQQLIDNPPEHALAFRKFFKEQQGETEESEANAGSKANEKPGVWMPGPGSWQPGDGIPAGYRIERNEWRGRFPKGTE